MVLNTTNNEMRPRILGTPDPVQVLSAGRYCGGILFCIIQDGEQK